MTEFNNKENLKKDKEYILNHPDEWTEYNILLWYDGSTEEKYKSCLNRMIFLRDRVALELGLSILEATLIAKFRGLPQYTYIQEVEYVQLLREGYIDKVEKSIMKQFQAYD